MKRFDFTAGAYFLAIATIVVGYGAFLYFTGQLTEGNALVLSAMISIWLSAYVVVGYLVARSASQHEETLASWLESLPDPVGDAVKEIQEPEEDSEMEATAHPASILRWGYEGEEEKGRYQ